MVSKSAGRVGGTLALALALSAPVPGVCATTMSWSVQLAGPVLAASGARARSPQLNGGASGRVTWVRWRVDYGQLPLSLRLCQAGHCIGLPASSGSSDAFAGLPAAGFFFELQRQEGAARVRAPVLAATGELTLIVEYRDDE